MLKEITEIPASEKYLKIFFFQMYLGNRDSNYLFFKDGINSIIVSKTFDEMLSSELFQFVKIDRRWGEEDLTSYLPDKFFYIKPNKTISDKDIYEHPTLYTEIKPIIDNSIYEAKIIDNCHLLNNLGENLGENLNSNCSYSHKLETFKIKPNLYDNGYYDLEVYSENLIVVTIYDENNGLDFSFFQFINDSCLLQVSEINDKQLLQSISINWNSAKVLQYANSELLNNLDFMLFFINSRIDDVIEFASWELKNNFDFVLKTVENNGRSLEYASESLKSDRNVVLAAVKSDGRALEYASESLKSDRNFVLAAVKLNGFALQFVSESFKSDKDVILAAVNSNGRALEYASKELRGDKDIVLKSVKEDIRSVVFASEDLKNDEDIKNIIELKKTSKPIDDDDLPF